MHCEKFIWSLTTTKSSIRPSISGETTILKELSAICSGSNHALLPIPAAPLISSTPMSTTSRVYRMRADALCTTFDTIANQRECNKCARCVNFYFMQIATFAYYYMFYCPIPLFSFIFFISFILFSRKCHDFTWFYSRFNYWRIR